MRILTGSYILPGEELSILVIEPEYGDSDPKEKVELVEKWIGDPTAPNPRSQLCLKVPLPDDYQEVNEEGNIVSDNWVAVPIEEIFRTIREHKKMFPKRRKK